jgi:ATP-dependent helicase/DNAse subunit B
MWMSITLITGPANAGKAPAVLDAVRVRAARGEDPLLVVPTRADLERYRRELAEGGLVLGVRVERFQGLLAEIVRRAAVAGRPLSPLLRERALASVAARTCSPPELATRPGFVRALAALVEELEVQRIAPARLRGALERWAAAGGLRVRAAELSDLFDGYHRLLEELGCADPELRSTRALDALRRSPALWGTTPVALYGFDDLTPLQLDAIETLGRVVDAPVTVSLAYEPGRIAFAGRGRTFQTLLPWASEHRALDARAEYYAPRARVALHHLERGLFETDQPSAPVDPAGAVRMLEGGSPRAELELVAGEIRALLDAGVKPGEVAIAHRSPGTIAELLGEVLDAFEIPFALPSRLRFAHTALGRALCGLLAAACGEEGRLEDLLAWLRAPGLLERPELADRLEADARRAGVWSAAGARALWEAEHWPLETLDRLHAAAGRGPLALVERATRELQWLFCAPRRAAAAVLLGESAGEARAFTGATRALKELAELARTVPSLAPSPAELGALLAGLELAPDEDSESSAQDAVAVLDPLALRARRVRALFLCGLQEGLFPAPARALPVLSEEERWALADASGLRLGAPEEPLAAERYLFYAAVSRPEELLALSWHTATEEGDSSVPSLFLDDVCDLFAQGLRGRCSRRPAGAAHWPGPGASPSTWAERELALAGPRRAWPPLRPLADAALLAELRQDRLWSASSLKLWADCPARWFVERLLRARDLDPDPEPLARGGLAHAALRDTFEGLRRQSGSARLTAERLPAARALLHDALARHARDFPLSVAPERIPGVRRRLEADLERYLEHAAGAEEGKGSPLEPSHLELGFGFPEDTPALAPLDLGGGVRLRGRIDRVDVAVSGEGVGSAVVYDYKGAFAAPADSWLGERSMQVALYMSAVEQLLHQPVVGGFYQPLSGRDLRARGVLAEGSGVELECVRGEIRPPEEVHALVDELLELAREAAREADAGALEPRPGTCAFGDGTCMYPSICRCER